MLQIKTKLLNLLTHTYTNLHEQKHLINDIILGYKSKAYLQYFSFRCVHLY